MGPEGLPPLPRAGRRVLEGVRHGRAPEEVQRPGHQDARGPGHRRQLPLRPAEAGCPEGHLLREGHRPAPPDAGGLRPLLLLHLELCAGPPEVPRLDAHRRPALVPRQGLHAVGHRLLRPLDRRHRGHRRQGDRVLRGRRLRGQEAPGDREGEGGAAPEGRGAHQAHGRRPLPHRRLHAGRPRPRGPLPLHPGPRGLRHRGERRRGRRGPVARRPRDPVLPGVVRRLQVLQAAGHQPLHLCARLHGLGRHGGGQQAEVLLRGQAHLPLHGHELLLGVRRAPRAVAGQGPPRRPAGEGLPPRLRHLHGLGRRLEHGPGGARRHRGGLRPRRRGPQRGRGPGQGGRLEDRRRGPPAREAGAREEVGRHGCHQPEGPAGGQDDPAVHRRHDRVRRGLLLRLHRQHHGDAPGPGVLRPRLGRLCRYRRRRGGPGDRHAPLPARHRALVEGHRLRRLEVEAAGSDAGGPLHGRRPQDRRVHHAQHGLQGHQRGLRPAPQGRVPSRRPEVLRAPS
mmetsp:Transcript_48941/g.144445  ORF Transcript_48941/g.144445 Transcript_48941/m.144445 type:complete len:509 (+) Transcript_48941:611-2137(+)